jgi:hypothetical protein
MMVESSQFTGPTTREVRMSIEQEERWITGEEIGREYRRLIEAGVSYEAPEFQELFTRITARDNELYERYGKRYLDTQRGKWIAISLDGQVIIRDTAGEVTWAAGEAFGDGNYAKRKLADFPGHVLFR